MMWLDVIADCRWCDDGSLQAILTKRVFEQLVPPDASPASRRVPLIPLRRLAANAHGSTYHPPAGTPSTGPKSSGTDNVGWEILSDWAERSLDGSVQGSLKTVTARATIRPSPSQSVQPKS